MIGQGSTTGRDLCSRIDAAIQQQFPDHETGLCKTYDFEFKELDGEYWYYLLYTYPSTSESSPTDGLLFIAPGVKPALSMEDYFEGVNIIRDAISDCKPAIVEVDTQGRILTPLHKGLLIYEYGYEASPPKKSALPDGEIKKETKPISQPSIKRETSSNDIPEEPLKQLIRQTVLAELPHLPEWDKVLGIQDDLALLANQLGVFTNRFDALELVLIRLQQIQTPPPADTPPQKSPSSDNAKLTETMADAGFNPQKRAVIANSILQILARSDLKTANTWELSEAIAGCLDSIFDRLPGMCRYYDFSFNPVTHAHWYYLMFVYPTDQANYGLLFAASGVTYSGTLGKYFKGGREFQSVRAIIEPAYLVCHDEAEPSILRKGILETS